MKKEDLLTLSIFEDNEYLDLYVQLVSSNEDTKPQKHRTQRHHIVPRYYFKENNIPIDNSDKNTVNLLYKDHILAHYYLTMCSLSKYRYANELALIGMLNRKCVEEQYNEIVSSMDKYQLLYEEAQKHNSDKHKGKKHTAETRNKMSKSRKGHKVSEETRRKISEANKGKYSNFIWIHKETINKRISPDLLQQYLLQGFEIGRNDPEAFDKIKANNHMHTGMLGKKQTDYQKQKAREAKLGKHPSEETRRKMSEAAKRRYQKHNEE